MRNGRVFFADGNAYFNRPGPRLADSGEILAQMLHGEPELSNHATVAWVRHKPEAGQGLKLTSSTSRGLPESAARPQAHRRAGASSGRIGAVVEHDDVLGLGEEQPSLEQQSRRQRQHGNRRADKPSAGPNAAMGVAKRDSREIAIGTAKAKMPTSPRNALACLRATL